MRRGNRKGSFTVEISLIMTLLIPILVCLIYVGFYMHDRAFLDGAALETACVASLHSGEKNQGRLVEAKKEEFLSGRLMGTKNIEGKVTLGKDRVTVVFTGEFHVPGMTAKLFGAETLSVRSEAELDLKEPRKTVNKIHSLEKLAKQEEK